MLDLTNMSRGNKACLLTIITLALMVFGAFMLFIGPDNTQETGDRVTNDDIFYGGNGASSVPNMLPSMLPTTMAPTGTPNIMRPPISIPVAPVQAPTFPPLPNPTLAPVLLSTPSPTRRTPIVSPILPQPTPLQTPQPQAQPAMGAPIPVTPTYSALRNYPFAVVYECDWKGDRITLTTKTESHNVVRLCIEAPPLPDTEEPVEISYLNMFIFTRQAYDEAEKPLEPITQHAVLRGKPDPFGLTLLNCPPGTPVCRFATSLRKEFFTDDAFLVGSGELVLQFQATKAVAGMAPITIYFLLSSTDIREPFVLGRRASPVVETPHNPQQSRYEPKYEPKHEPKYERHHQNQGRLGSTNKPLILNKPAT